MGRMFLGRVRAPEGRAPLFDGDVPVSDYRNRMFEIGTRTQHSGAGQAAVNRRGA